MTQTAQRNSQSANREARARFALQMAEQAAKVGARIAELRTQRGWSRPELARRLPGVSTGNDVYRWEGGQHMPRADTLEAIAEVFDVTVADLHSGPSEDADAEVPAAPAPDPFASPGGVDAERFDRMVQRQAEVLAAVARVESQVAEVLELLRQRSRPATNAPSAR